MKTARGFSLIEMAFVLVIVTLLLGGLLVPFSTQVEQKRIAETQKTLDETKEALVGYALANGYLPCPDIRTAIAGGTPNDGLEDSDSLGQCLSYEGNIPWATLGVGAVDAWGNRLRYRVDPAFAIHSTGYIKLTSTANLRVCQNAGCAVIVADKIPAILLSHGKNGYGAINATTNQPNIAPGATLLDELENTNGDTIFVSRVQTGPGAGNSEFDDLVAWLSPNVLFNRMVAAGKLP